MNEKLILVIDDSQFLCAMLKKSLDSVGYNTLVAHTSEDGLRLFEQSLPDLVLLDINLPDIPGPEACRRLKANPQWQGISVILMSGSYEDYIRQQVAECGANGYIKKPFSPSSILRWVKENAHALFSDGHGVPGDFDEAPVIMEPPVPQRPAPPAPAPSRRQAATFDGAGYTIVITDDSTFLCAILKDTLEKVGFAVHTFSNIRDTGYYLKGNQADLLFLDVNLPDIAGDRACAIIKESPKTRNLPIILISSAKEEQLRALVASSGANGYLIKPFTPLNVLEWIKLNASAMFGGAAAASPPAASPVPAPSPSLPPTPPQAPPAVTAPGPQAPETQAPAATEGPTDGEIDILLKQLDSPMKEVRLDACYTLGEFNVSRAVERLMDMLYDSDDEIRGEAAWALGEIRDSRALQPILNLLVIKNKWLRDRACEALGKLGDPQAVPPLVNILKTNDKELRITAIKALATIPGPETVAALEALVSERDEEIAANATWALRRLGGLTG